jgi:hypothetical protein
MSDPESYQPDDGLNELLKQIEGAVEDDPDLLQTVLEDAMSRAGCFDMVIEFVDERFNRACRDLNLDRARGWMALRELLGANADLDFASEDEVLEELSSQDAVEAASLLSLDFWSDPDPDFANDPRYSPLYAIAEQSKPGQEIMSQAQDVIDCGFEISTGMLARAQAIKDNEEFDEALGIALGALLDRYVPPCAKDCMQKAICSGDVHYLLEAYEATTYLSDYNKLTAMLRSMDKYLCEFLSRFCSDEEKYKYIEQFGSSMSRQIELRQSLKLGV